MREFDETGVCLVPRAVSEDDLRPLREAVDGLVTRGPGNRLFELPAPNANLPDIRAILTDIADRLAGRPARLVRILAFDKTPGSNWGVPWHQDRTIAVARRVETPGYGPWSAKGGVPHVEPPEAMLRAMFSLRLHLDDCGEENGPLRVIPGSHRCGRLPFAKVADLGADSPARTCTAAVGDVLAMRALTVHASEPARKPGHRRVLHLDFATAQLPAPLNWAIESPDQPGLTA